MKSSPTSDISNRETQPFQRNATIVVFGASGDLAKKKIFPTLFTLYCLGSLPQNIKIIGYARTQIEPDEFQKRVSAHFKTTDKTRPKILPFLQLISYISGQYDTDEGYIELKRSIVKHEDTVGSSPSSRYRLLYLAVPPTVFVTVAVQSKKHLYPPLNEGQARLVVEKPFGRNTSTSNELQEYLKAQWAESEIYRIDHYLGKEMVKNILLLRFGNVFLNAAHNKEHISNIQIVFKEQMSTEGRGGYFDDMGIIRDVMQNHLMQVLCLMTMERPVSTSSEDVRDEKVKILRAIKPITLDDVVLGQYGRSENSSKSPPKPAYTDDQTVPDTSRSLTYAAVRLFIGNERWDGVPIILRAGKALDESKVEIRVQYKAAPRGMYYDLPRNELVIRIQPNESIYLKINNKLPGYSEDITVTDLDLTYNQRYPNIPIPDAYEALLRDCLSGNPANFVRADELELAWKVFSPLLDEIDQNENIKPEIYPHGSEGPKSVNQFLRDKGDYKSTMTEKDI
ncbi:glucose-6-phosphate dehydrogenase [Nadsonia fulvescens var. elongata DSM 6958]|uniref:Glucose-6-phosphate 1-dehydrogenase n=1 Tax=Nadsonia fulvescens var. elongata DSM 6958 TaxID=857566 RepID=A0A1E3PIU0_9ASCO|nr:glucose-6-phosphate dehydrogenase [Nadsonia fulvescens var. elongata DSM 6958]